MLIDTYPEDEVTQDWNLGSTFFYGRKLVFDADKLRVGVVGLSSLAQSQNRVIDFLQVIVTFILVSAAAFIVF